LAHEHDSKEPIRLFRSDFLESFTHIHPAVVLSVWVPVVAAFLTAAIVRAARTGAASAALYIPLGYLAGLFLWTLVEYLLHRFVFHFKPRTPRQERISFLVHGVHHAQPMEKTRLVMPPAVSVPLALLFYGLFWLVIGLLMGRPAWVAPLFAGLVSGYIAYDMLHYSTHHFRLRPAALRFLRSHHMRHHAGTWNDRFGVSSPLWDYVFGTMPADRAQEEVP
jgi:sterol desaturase/sphingolipid hydroxylase (fatty acid hydroxylase superfamily)